VNGCETEIGKFLGAEEVVHVGAGIAFTCKAVALGVDGLCIMFEACPLDVHFAK